VIERRTGIGIPPHFLFDVQVKRIHEYKRQTLNVLHAIHLYERIKRGDTEGLVPRAIIVGGKAAPGYVMAKHIIKFANNVARVINDDPDSKDYLRMVFVPDYNVSAMELICPAAELSEQISTAGKEASGTGNMKLMMNGAVTIGTLDGANVEILEAVGPDNFFRFGLSVDEVESARKNYEPTEIIAADPDIASVFRLLDSGCFDGDEPGVLDSVIAALRDSNDQWLTVADLGDFIGAQRAAAQAHADSARWTRMSILNTSASGPFSTDRTSRDYNDEIWRLKPVGL
jgi:starch phosphorylase